MKKSRIFLCILMTLVTLFLVWFILFNSSLNADDSTEDSMFFVDLFNNFFKSIGINISFTDHLIRKIAHFTEFTALGMSTITTLICYKLKNKLKIIISLAFGLSITITDELSQMFSLGRSCQITDMIIDFSGVLFGTFFIYLIFYLVTRKKIKNNE